jgi:hypothetical protein
MPAAGPKAAPTAVLTQLAACDPLTACTDTECTYFHQFVLLAPKAPPPKGKPNPGGRLPDFYGVMRDPSLSDAAVRRFRALAATLRVRFPEIDPPPRRRGTRAKARAELAARRIEAMLAANPEAIVGSGPVAVARGGVRTRAMASARGGPTVRFGLMLSPLLKAVIDIHKIMHEMRTNARWAVGIEYQQCWTNLGYCRGRLVRSIPLTPGEQMEIQVRTWNKRTTRKNLVESVERNLSTEVTNEEKWAIASKMNFVDSVNANVNPHAGVTGGVTIPVDVVPVDLSGDLGIDGNLGNTITQTTDRGSDFIQAATLRSAEGLKSVRTNTVETIHEIGTETATKQLIANTNRCHTVTYHYFEILEHYRIETRRTRTALYLMVPLPLPDLSDEKLAIDWMLCHEPLLRQMLPSPDYYAGFEGARRLKTFAVQQQLTSGLAAALAAETPKATSFHSLVDDVLDRYALIDDAELVPMADGPLESLGSAAEDVLGAIGKFGEDIANGEDVGKAAQDFVETTSKAFQDLGKELMP